MKSYLSKFLLLGIFIVLISVFLVNGCITSYLTCSQDGLLVRVYDDLAKNWYQGAKVHVNDRAGSCGKQLVTTDVNGQAYFDVPDRGGIVDCYVEYQDQLGQWKTTPNLQIFIDRRQLITFDVHINTDPYIGP